MWEEKIGLVIDCLRMHHYFQKNLGIKLLNRLNQTEADFITVFT